MILTTVRCVNWKLFTVEKLSIGHHFSLLELGEFVRTVDVEFV